MLLALLLSFLPGCSDGSYRQPPLPEGFTESLMQSTAMSGIIWAVVEICGDEHFSLPSDEWVPESPPSWEVYVYLCEEYWVTDQRELLVEAADACLHEGWRAHGGYDEADCPELGPCLEESGIHLPDPWPDERLNLPSSPCYVSYYEEPD